MKAKKKRPKSKALPLAAMTGSGWHTSSGTNGITIRLLEPEIPKSFNAAMRELRAGKLEPMFKPVKGRKTLGQIAYDATTEGGKQNFGSWLKAPEVVRRVYEQMANAVARAVLRRQRGGSLNDQAHRRGG